MENYSEGDGAFGYAHSYETGSSVDGPGIRITLFLSGCPLKCQYCHNPDTWRLQHGMRISLSVYNNHGDIDRLLEALS